MKQFIICPNCGYKKESIDGFSLCPKCDYGYQSSVKAISIKQPYAYLTASGICDIINSKRKTNFRGRVLIHAGAKQVKYWENIPVIKDYYTGIAEYAGFTTKEIRDAIKDKSKFTSAIIGSVEIVDCVINHESVWAEKTEYAHCESPISCDLPCSESCEYFKRNKPIYN
jgi:hypothetical protein